MIPIVPAELAACCPVRNELPAIGPPIALTSASKRTLTAVATSHPKKAAPQLKPPNFSRPWGRPFSLFFSAIELPFRR
jgi:hypothetical protein